jgi:hypothetical protein
VSTNLIEATTRIRVPGPHTLTFYSRSTDFLRFGQYTAAYVLENDAGQVEFVQCHSGIDELWYLLWVPLAVLSWSGLFTPGYRDLPLMTFHGILAYGINFALGKAGVEANVNNFSSSLIVSLSAGIWSRFTGRQAVSDHGIFVAITKNLRILTILPSVFVGWKHHIWVVCIGPGSLPRGGALLA